GRDRNVRSGAGASVKPAPPGKVPLPCAPGFAFVAPSGERMMIGCGDGVRLVELPSGRERRAWAEADVMAFAFSRDGARLAVADQTTLRVLRASDAGPVAEPRLGRYPTVLELSPDGRPVVLSPVGRTVEVWSPGAPPRRLATLASDFGGGSAAAWSPDGGRLAVACDDTVVRIYDARTFAPIAEVRGQTLPTLALAWSPDGQRLALGVAGGTIV